MPHIGKSLAKYGFIFSSIAVAAYALSYYWHSDNPFNVRFHDLNPIGVYSHFIGAGCALLLGGLQLTTRIGSSLHCSLGYAYCIAIIIGALGGFYLAMHAYLGLATAIAFYILEVCWLGATGYAVLQARAGNRTAHREWILRSLALTGAGISLRILLPLFGIFFSFDTSYLLAVWLCWIVNLIIIETYLYFSKKSRHRHLFWRI